MDKVLLGLGALPTTVAAAFFYGAFTEDGDVSGLWWGFAISGAIALLIYSVCAFLILRKRVPNKPSQKMKVRRNTGQMAQGLGEIHQTQNFHGTLAPEEREGLGRVLLEGKAVERAILVDQGVRADAEADWDRRIQNWYAGVEAFCERVSADLAYRVQHGSLNAYDQAWGVTPEKHERLLQLSRRMTRIENVLNAS